MNLFHRFLSLTHFSACHTSLPFSFESSFVSSFISSVRVFSAFFCIFFLWHTCTINVLCCLQPFLYWGLATLWAIFIYTVFSIYCCPICDVIFYLSFFVVSEEFLWIVFFPSSCASWFDQYVVAFWSFCLTL